MIVLSYLVIIIDLSCRVVILSGLVVFWFCLVFFWSCLVVVFCCVVCLIVPYLALWFSCTTFSLVLSDFPHSS